MLCMASAFAYIILCIFSAFRMLMEKGSAAIMMCCNTLFWATAHVALVFAIIYMGHTVKTEAQRTAVVLHKILNNEHDTTVMKKIMMFSQQIQHRKPNISCGLFSFDMNLAFSVSLQEYVEVN